VSNSGGTAATPMRVDDIRPDVLRRGQEEAYERDLQRLRARLPEFVPVPCPACDSTEASPAFTKYGFQFQRCGPCRTLYMSPRPTPAVMAAYYGNSENYRFWAEHIFPASEDARREKIHRPMLEYIVAACERHGVRRDRLVEIGPGFGTFAALASRSGTFTEVLAIERTPEMAQACRRRGVRVIEQAVEEVELAEVGEADVVASFEVIEHLFDPKAYVTSAARLLRAGGLLLLTCPNGEGFDTAMLGAHSGAVDSEHVNLFNPDSLAGLLGRTGFETLEVATPGRLDAELVRAAVLEGRLDLAGNPFLQEVLLRKWPALGAPFQAFLAANRLSGHLRILARRRD
jgi:SAM-dependent methyltransferase